MPNSCCIKSKVEWKVLMKRKCVPNKKKTILRKKETEPTTPSLSEINRNIQHAEEWGGRREEGQSIPCRHQLLRDQRRNQACGWRGTNIQKLITRNCIFELNLRIGVGPMGAVVRERERESKTASFENQLSVNNKKYIGLCGYRGCCRRSCFHSGQPH